MCDRCSHVGIIAWDFDGTLATRNGGWSGAVVTAIERTGHPATVTIEDIRPHLETGFPWHTPAEPHPDITDPDAWWGQLYPVLTGAVVAQGFDRAEATEIARMSRDIYLTEDWSLFPDVTTTLASLNDDGWTHVILSNHVPELSDIVDHLGLSDQVDAVFTSGRTGYEKPHPRAFDPVLNFGTDSTKRWMVGDSVSADIEGAKGVGLPAILVRNTDPAVDRQADGLDDIDSFLG